MTDTAAAADDTVRTGSWEPVIDPSLYGDAPGTAEVVDDTTSVEPPQRPSLLDHRHWPAIVAFIGALIGAGALSDNSFMTHLSTGRLILDGTVPKFDRFTWASEGEPLIAHSWGSSVLYAIGDLIGSGAGIRVMTAAFTCIGMLALWRLSAAASANVVRLSLVSISMVLAFAWWNERPQTVAYMALALGLVIVQDKRPVWWLVPLFFAWTNLHGSFAMGVPFLGVLMFLRVVETRSLGRREFAEVGAMVAGIVAAGVVNPYGFDLITFPVQQLQREAIVLIGEWQRLPFDSAWNVVFVGQACVVVLVLAWRRSWLRLVMAVVLFAMSIDSARYAPLAAIMFVPIVAPALAGLGTAWNPVRYARREQALIAAGIAAVVISVVVSTPNYNLSVYPVGEAAAFEERGWLGAERSELPKILTHDYVGNYLEWRNGTNALPWIDDRAEVHSFDTLKDYSRLLSKDQEYATIAARHPHDIVLWRADEFFADTLRSDDTYEVLGESDNWIVACVRTSAFCTAETAATP